MFEPVHGSAPPLAGKDKANPVAAVLSLAMLLSHLGAHDAAAVVNRAAEASLIERMCTDDTGGALGTRAAGDWIRGIEPQGFL